jgi:ribosome-binding protein aMBF1 (putative translation factor)
MKIKCNICGKDVSTEVPDGTIIRASVECPECLFKYDEKCKKIAEEALKKERESERLKKEEKERKELIDALFKLKDPKNVLYDIIKKSIKTVNERLKNRS